MFYLHIFVYVLSSCRIDFTVSGKNCLIKLPSLTVTRVHSARSWTIIRGVYIKKIWRCPWCNGYRRRKWTRRHEFKSWSRLIAFHIALIPLGKVWIQLFSLQLRVNSRTDWFFSLGEATSLENSEFKLRLKIDLVSYPARAEGLVNMIRGVCIWQKRCHLCMYIQHTSINNTYKLVMYMQISHLFCNIHTPDDVTRSGRKH